MRIVWSLFAIDDLVAIRAFIAAENPRAAESAAQRILNAVNLLADRPHLGVPTHRVDIRKLVVARSPYVIPYRVVDEAVEILGVFDGLRNAPRTDVRRR